MSRRYWAARLPRLDNRLNVQGLREKEWDLSPTLVYATVASDAIFCCVWRCESYRRAVFAAFDHIHIRVRWGARHGRKHVSRLAHLCVDSAAAACDMLLLWNVSRDRNGNDNWILGTKFLAAVGDRGRYVSFDWKGFSEAR